MDAIIKVLAPILDPLARMGVPPMASVTLLIGLVLAVLFMLLSPKGGLKAKKDTILLLGNTGGGKTVLFHQLQFSKLVESHTSMREVEGTFAIGDTGVTAHVVDVPGHPRLRPIVNDFVPVTIGIVFLVDSTRIKTDLRDTAEYLYSIMTNERFVENGVRVQVVCNKQDLTATAKSSRFIKMALQREIDELCKSKAASPDQLGTDEGEKLLVDEGETFQFKDAPLDIEFLEAGVKNGDSDKGYKAIEEFIASCLS